MTDEQWSWASTQTKKAEAVLFMNKQWSKTESMTACSHCHVEKGRSDDLPILRSPTTDIEPGGFALRRA